MVWFIAIGALLASLGCATPARQNLETLRQADPNHPVYVGHSASGEVVMATTHADAMHGLAVAASDLGVPTGSSDETLLLCRKEMLTGTHVPTWICRYPTEVERQRMQTQNWLDQPKSCDNCALRGRER